jgi:lysozyme
MKTSEDGINFIVGFEGKLKLLADGRYTAYKCPAGVWTIYAGCTEGVHEGMIVTEDQGKLMLAHELKKAEAAINRLVTVPLTQTQFDVLVSFTYNVGVSALQHSTLLRDVNKHDFAAVPAQLALWIHGGGKVLPGLVRRRKEEGVKWASTYSI